MVGGGVQRGLEAVVWVDVGGLVYLFGTAPTVLVPVSFTGSRDVVFADGVG